MQRKESLHKKRQRRTRFAVFRTRKIKEDHVFAVLSTRKRKEDHVFAVLRTRKSKKTTFLQSI
jgi:hypothetical protein